MLYNPQPFFQKTGNLQSAISAVDTSATLAASTFGTVTGKQRFVIDGGVSGSAEIVRGNIAGTAITNLERGLNGTTGVLHAANATVELYFEPGLLSTALSQDGWLEASETFTYVSATTMTAPVDLRSVLSKGDKLKLTNSTLKYFNVTDVTYSAPNSTVTVTGGSDYSLANAAISDVSYSHAQNPTGFPATFSYTPALTNIAGTAVGEFSLEGGWMSGTVVVSVTGGGSGAYSLAFPVNAVDVQYTVIGGAGAVDVSPGGVAIGNVIVNNATTMRIAYSADTTAGYSEWGTTVPFTWANGDFIRLQFRARWIA